MDNSKRKNKWLIIIEALVIFLIFVIAFELGKKVSQVKENNINLELIRFFKENYQLNKDDKLYEVINVIKNRYVENVNIDSIEEKVISILLEQLDPHSIYIPPLEAKSENEQMEGNFEGIGIYFNIQNDTVTVVGIISGGPAEKTGLLPGDKIILVDDSSIVGASTSTITNLIKGPKGSKVKITVLKPITKDTITYIIERDIIPIKSVDVFFRIKNDIGYIKISRFAKNTYDEFVNAINELHKKNVKKIILDLRDNAGGYMNVAVKIADLFLPKGKVIVYIEGANQPQKKFFSTDNDLCLNDSVAILINEWTASASEILAGAIQDNDKGVIIGRRSFGKGLVQEPYEFSDGSVVRLTIARYFTPTGRCIQKDYNKGIENYYSEISKRFSHGELVSKDSIHFPDSLKYRTPKGKIVYGGGGIMPDIFVPLDTSSYDDFYYEVIARNLLYSFAIKYFDQNRKKIIRSKSYKKLYNHLKKTKVWQEFLIYTKKQGAKYKPKTEKTISVLKDYLYAYIIRLQFGDDGFYPIYLKHDKTFNTAIKYLEKHNTK